MKKGSITIFSLLSMMLVASALFALLEASRFQQMRRLMQLQTQVALESAFAEYNTYLWEEYRVLACKQSDVEGNIEESVENRKTEDSLGTNFFQFQIKEMKQEGYTRLTDADGKAFIQAVTGYMEKNLLYETAKTIYNQYEGMKEIKDSSSFDFSTIEKALTEMEEEQNSVGSTGVSGEEEVSEENPYSGTENPLEIILKLRETGILSLVLEDTSSLSEHEMDLTKVVSQRELPAAYNPNIKDSDWYTRVLFQQYLLTYLSNYMDEKEHALKYEVEYVLGGKSTEVENMKAVVTQLLGIREAANFFYLVSNPTKVEQARLLAIAIVGSSLNPVLINVVKTAVLAAWAFVEGILDIRTLLTGGKIALIKSDTTWTMDLEALSSIGDGYIKAKDCSNGLGYEEYLGILLLFQKDTQLAKRAMDVQELTLREKYENENICLEEWIVHLNIQVTYEYVPVFFSVERIVPDWNYEISLQEEFGY